MANVFTALLFLVFVVSVTSDFCPDNTFGSDCQYVMNENCAVYVNDTTKKHVCFEFQYFDCEDKLELVIYKDVENIYGETYNLPVGSHKEFSFPDWEGHSICETFESSMCEDDSCPQYCVRLTNVFVDPTMMQVCALINIFGHTKMFPYEFCQTISYSECGHAGYFYPPCEHLRAATILWDSAFISSLDTAEISNLPYDYFQAAQSLCMFVENTTSGVSYPFECLSFAFDTCESRSTPLLLANGYIPFVTQVDGEGIYCFEGAYDTEMFCVNIHSFQVDHTLREILFVCELAYSNSKISDNNTISVLFNETSLHYPACGDIKCTPGHHAPINWELINDPYYEPSVATNQNVPVTQGEEETVKKPKKHKSSNTTLIAVLSSLGGVFVIVALMGILLLLGVLGKRKYQKRGLLLENMEEEYEMVDMNGLINDDADLLEEASLLDDNDLENLVDSDNESIHFDSDDSNDSDGF